MDDIEAMAAWLRQRDGETDAAWIGRLEAVFQAGPGSSADAKADRIGERLWTRFQARLKAEKRDT